MFRRSLLFLALLLLSSNRCFAATAAPGDTSSTVVLDAAFNGDTVGLPPDVTLPGAPSGDYLTLNQAAGTITVVSGIDGLANQPVLLKQNNDAGGVALLAWNAPTPPGLEQVIVRWRSLARDDNPVSLLRCAILGAGGAVIASVEYRPHGDLTYNSVGDATGPLLPVGYQQNTSQQFTIVADFLTRTTSLSIDGVPLAGFQNVPFAEPATGLATAAFKGEETHPQSLVVDDISAVAFCRAPDYPPALTAPAFVPGAEGSALSFGVSAADPDGTPISSLAAAPLPPGATFTHDATNTTGTFDWTPDFTQAGDYSVTFTASNALSGSATTSISIADVDRVPIVTAPIGVAGEEGGTLDVPVTAEDPDGDPIVSLTADLTGLPAGNLATFTPDASNTSGVFHWPMMVHESGQYTVPFTAVAANGATGSAQTVINVGVNGISVTGQVIWTPMPGDEGSHFVTFTAIDQFGDTGQSVTEIIVQSAAPGAAVSTPAGAVSPAPGAHLAPGVSGNAQKGPVVSSPKTAYATVSSPVVVDATATEGSLLSAVRVNAAGAMTSAANATAALLTLTADLSQLGGDAIFLVDKDPIVSAPANVTANAGLPVAFNVGADDPDGDPILSLSADLSAFPNGNLPAFSVNDTHTIGAFTWTPGVSDSGDYEAVFTATNRLVGVAATAIHVRGVAQGIVFQPGNNKKIHLNANKPSECIVMEPVNGAFDIIDVDPTTIRLYSEGTGSVTSIGPILKSIVIGDRDGNQVADMTLCFTKDDLRMLFSDLHGNNVVPVTVGGSLTGGGLFSAEGTLTITAGGGGNLAASVTPNPMNPSGTLTFTTAKHGLVRVRVYDLAGRLVRQMLDGRLAAGFHEVPIDGLGSRGERLASGVYFFRIDTPEGTETGRFAIMK
jgi:hypothetical protein